MKDYKTLSYYDRHANSFAKNTLDLDMKPLLEKFISFLPEKACILDAGCGSGRDSLYFLNKGFNVTAFDASEVMCKMASRIIKQPVLHISFEELSFVNEFDGIWACASVLHIKRCDQLTAIRKMCDALKPNGILYISWKYGMEEYYNGERFYCDMNEEMLLELLSNEGLLIIEMWQTNDVRSEKNSEKWLNVLLKKTN